MYVFASTCLACNLWISTHGPLESWIIGLEGIIDKASRPDVSGTTYQVTHQVIYFSTII
jgi:hypothetical protein